ncbi:hypothetical protein CEY16_07495 [Halalkalibacillus sediminis]|uniref:DNA-directed RNA polymerase subunit beta n=2 Tax=Halalkalibacillus sediminis TaxID=2018042 RepID=A0A2I0QV13_9BACI|nr:hypothetical protein CEY16_07495 [Halalkalibacillus sediminis]
MQQEAVEEKQEQQEQHEEEQEKKPQKEGKKSKKRKEVKEEKKEEEFKHKRKGFIRIFPVWLRVIVILALTVGALVAGLMVGYGVLGEGDDMNDVLDRQLWEGIYDYMRGE